MSATNVNRNPLKMHISIGKRKHFAIADYAKRCYLQMKKEEAMKNKKATKEAKNPMAINIITFLSNT